MAEDKIDVLMKIATVNLARAKKRFSSGEYDTAVFHASLAVENAANALVLRLGGIEAKNHKAIAGLTAVIRRVAPELLKDDTYMQLIKKGAQIQREVVYTRYPHKIDDKWITPMDYYTEEKTKSLIDDAVIVVETIKNILKEPIR